MATMDLTEQPWQVPSEMSQPAGGMGRAAGTSRCPYLPGTRWRSDVLLGPSQTAPAPAAFLSTPPGLSAGTAGRNAMCLFPNR